MTSVHYSSSLQYGRDVEGEPFTWSELGATTVTEVGANTIANIADPLVEPTQPAGD